MQTSPILHFYSSPELLHGQKLMLEYEKYNELQTKSTRMQEDYELQMRTLKKADEESREELSEYYESKLQDANGQLAQAHIPFA